MTRRLRASRPWVGIFLALCVVGPTGAAPDSGPAELLLDVSPAVGSATSVASVAEIDGRIDLAALASARFALELPDGSRIDARLDRIERRAADDWSWFGRVEPGSGEAILSARRGQVSGLLYAPSGVFQILPTAQGRHRLVELDPALFPECGGALTPPPATRPSTSPDQVTADPFDEFDVLVLYTPQALAAAGGMAQIETIAQNAVDISNTAYANSQIVPRLHLVKSAQVAHDDAGDMGIDLGWAASHPGVGWLRDVVGADLVSLLVADGGGACGIGYVQRNPGAGFAGSAFQVTALGCAVGNLSFAHEFGHNMGCEHNPENSSVWPNGGSYPWSYGHWHSANYRTVMSYSNPCTGGCTRQPYFSNSNVQFQGEATGILDERENYRTINATAEWVSNFRLRVDLLFVDDFESGGTGAWN